ASWRSAPLWTACQSCGRITVSTILQNTGPGATAWSPSTSVWSDEGVRHSITLRGRPNRVPSSTRRTIGKSARTAHVRLVHPRASNVSSKRTICGLPATCTRGLGGDPSPAVASREPSPPARIKPCALVEDPFDLGEPRDRTCLGMKLLRHPPRIDRRAVGHELEQQAGLLLDHLPEAEAADVGRPGQCLVRPLVERLERRIAERAAGRPVRRVEARAPM